METFITNGDEIILSENTFLVSEIDEDGTIISVNSDFTKISGYSVDELVGKNYTIVKHPDMPEDILNDLKQSSKQGDLWKGIIKNRTKDSSKFYWTFSIIVPVKGNFPNRFLYLGLKPTDDEIKENL